LLPSRRRGQSAPAERADSQIDRSPTARSDRYPGPDPSRHRFLLRWILVLVASLAPLRDAAAQADKAGAQPSPAPAARSTAIPTNTFDVRSFGARGDGQTDSTAAIQRAVNAAQAATQNEAFTGATVVIPSARKPFLLSAPIFVDGRFVEVRGEGSGTVLQPGPYYLGPMFVFGARRLNESRVDAWRFRKDSRSVLDPSATAAVARNGLATRGEANVVFQCHPLQLGGPSPTYKGIVPDYWTETTQLTIEFFLGRPRGVTWARWSRLFGLSDRMQPKPWMVSVGETGHEIALSFRTDDLGPDRFHYAVAPLPPGPGPWRVTLQLDLEAGAFSAWINGARAAAARVVSSPPPNEPFRPGLRLHKQDGVTPFAIGDAHGLLSHGAPVTDLELHGLRVSRGLVYRMDTPIERMVAMPWPVDDQHRYFESINNEKVQTVALLPLDEPAGTVVKSASFGGTTCGFWVLSKRRGNTAETLVLRDLQVISKLQPAVVLGEVLDFRAENIHAGHGLQGIGSLWLGCSYPITLRGCRLSGADAAYFGHFQILHATDTVLEAGREAIRLDGCNSTWDKTLITFMGPNTEVFVQLLRGEYAQTHRITDMIIDNEVAGPKRAILECEQGANCPTRLLVDALDISKTGSTAPIVRLLGFGVDGTYRPAKVDVRNVSNFSGDHKTALQVDGPGWYGSFDGSGLVVNATVAGDGAGKIQVTPPAVVP
jgi:hypothetical protein